MIGFAVMTNQANGDRWVMILPNQYRHYAEWSKFRQLMVLDIGNTILKKKAICTYEPLVWLLLVYFELVIFIVVVFCNIFTVTCREVTLILSTLKELFICDFVVRKHHHHSCFSRDSTVSKTIVFVCCINNFLTTFLQSLFWSLFLGTFKAVYQFLFHGLSVCLGGEFTAFHLHWAQTPYITLLYYAFGYDE